MLTATPTPKSSTTSGDGNMLLVEQGDALAQAGMRPSGDTITACVMCHGATAELRQRCGRRRT